MPHIARVDGRSGEAFWFLDSHGTCKILPGVLFHNAIDTLGDVREWRAIQTDRNRVELQLESLADAEQSFDETAFVRRLQAFGLPHEVHVDVEPVVGLQPDKQTGKFRRMLSQIGAPHEVEAP